MARYAIAPTKTNLLRLREEHAFAREGHQLLEQKKDILTAELLALMDSARSAEARMDNALRVAFDSLRRALVQMGRATVVNASHAIVPRISVSVASRRVMGVTLPRITLSTPAHAPDYSPGETSFWLNQLTLNFEQATQALGTLVETKGSLKRLAREVRKTIRRVNALEKIALPDLQDTVQYIRNVLEEMERETFFTMKLIKNRLAERRSRRGRP